MNLLFQQAAGIFNYLKDIVLSHIQNKEPTPDISNDSLNALSSLMLAQAQDCIYRKAVKGKFARLHGYTNRSIFLD